MPDKLKDLFFTEKSIQEFADSILKQHPTFPKEKFVKQVHEPPWEKMELKAKMRHVTHCLRNTLPPDYLDALLILLKAAPEIRGFEGMTLPDFVEVYGMNHWEESLNALGQFTRYASSEFAIRPFLDKNPELVMHYMKIWANDKNPNVRRFASEGCRPRLPWAMVLPKFVVNPTPVLEVLELLKDDESEFVRKSVANNLNDISKDNPERALETAIRWYGYSDRTNRIVKHGLRTLLKKGNTRALRLFGFGDPSTLKIEGFEIDKKSVSIGDSMYFSFGLVNTKKKPQKVRLEYKIDFVKANESSSGKIFQILEKEFPPGPSLIKRKHGFHDLTTRKHYPGVHRISIIVNGESMAERSFHLTGPER